MPLRVLLDKDDFAKLVTGEIVECHTSDGKTIQVALSDIGFAMMVRTIADAIRKKLGD